MRKAIKFSCDEKIEKKRIMVENGIYNGFGKMIDLPPTTDIELLKQNFDTKELGDLFIDLGNELKKEELNITDISIDYSFEENPVSMGKRFMVALYYDTVDVEEKGERK
jgi:hypothetical protein